MDSVQPAAAQRLLLSLLAGDSHTQALRIELGSGDWQDLRSIAQQHRLGPLLHWQFTHGAIGVDVPQSFREWAAASFRRHALRSLKLRREMVRIHRILRERGIKAVELKGAFLAFFVYPHPALRPLRDLDVLVPRDRAVEAFDALMQAGFIRPGNTVGDPAAALECRKHLPALVSADTGVIVELHTRLVTPHTAGGSSPGEPADNPAVWERLIHREIDGEDIAFLSPADQLLHLIIHGLVMHRMNNGPLTLPDVSRLVRQMQIHWPTFWEMAAAGGWQRACGLFLAMVGHFCRPLPFHAPQSAELPSVPEDLMLSTALLSMAEYDHRPHIGFRAALMEAGSLRAQARVVFSRLCPPRQYLAAGGPGSMSGGTSYLNHWWGLATTRIPQYLAFRKDRRSMEASADLVRLHEWLTP